MRCLFESVHHDYSKRCRIINAWHAEGAQWTLTGEPSPLSALHGAMQDHFCSRLCCTRMHRVTAASSDAHSLHQAGSLGGH